MPAAADVRDDVLGLLGLESIDHAPPGCDARIRADLNAVLQQLYSLNPDTFWSEDQRAEQVRAPTTVTLDVTNGSKEIAFTGFQPWMGGCTIIIAGDDDENQLVQDRASGVQLMKPYQGTTGTGVTATVYQDVVQLGVDVEQAMAPVMLEGFWELVPVKHERDRQVIDAGSMTMNTNHGLTGRLYPLSSSRRAIQVPRAYLIERHAVFNGPITTRIRFSGLPDQAMVLSYLCKLTGVPRVEGWDDTRKWLVPYGYHESILLPMVRYRFAGWPQFTGSKNDLKPDYDAALAILGNLNPKAFGETHVAVGGDW